jgi:nucleoside-diphosphate-sugar epimerase
VDDTVRAILQTLVVPEAVGNVINIASGEPVSIREMIEKICSLTGSGKPLYGEINYRPGENMTLYANISKAKRILNWESTTKLDEGLKKTIDWYTKDHA